VAVRDKPVVAALVSAGIPLGTGAGVSTVDVKAASAVAATGPAAGRGSKEATSALREATSRAISSQNCRE